MNLNDQEFTKIMKQSKRKQLNKTVLTSLLVVVMSLAIALGSYLFYFNLGLFQDEKVAGVPNNHLKILEQQRGPLSLLFGASGGYAYNTEGEKLTVYLDYYEKDVRKKHEEITGIWQEKSGPMNGEMYWGITSKEGGVALDELRVTLNNRGALMMGSYDFNQLNLDTSEGLGSALNAFESGRVKTKKRYVMQTWSTNGIAYSEEYAIFSKKRLRKSPQTAILYFTIE